MDFRYSEARCEVYWRLARILNLAQSVLLSFAAYYSTLSWLHPSSLDMITW